LIHPLFLGGGLAHGLIWDGVESVPTTLNTYGMLFGTRSLEPRAGSYSKIPSRSSNTACGREFACTEMDAAGRVKM